MIGNSGCIGDYAATPVLGRACRLFVGSEGMRMFCVLCIFFVSKEGVTRREEAYKTVWALVVRGVEEGVLGTKRGDIYVE